MSSKRSGRAARQALAALSAGTLACLLASMTACERGSGGAAAANDRAVRVKVAKPVRQEVVRRMTLPGSVRADLEVTLYAKVTGYVKTITKDRGDHVKSGEIIAVLEIPEMNMELEHARASFAMEDTTLTRLEAIRKLEKTAVTDQDLDLARAKRAMSQASLRRLQTMLDYTEIHAPFDGYVTERFVDPGAFVQQGRIVSIVDASTVRILVDVPEREVRFMNVGSRADIRVDAIAGKMFEAKVARMSTSLDLSTRTLRVELDLPNKDFSVRPGMYAHVVLETERRPNALVVPSDAVISQLEKKFIFISDGGKVKKVEVTRGITDDTWTEITAGLGGEEFIILPGVQTLAEGMQVQPAEGS
jgi:membrane fusion protein (multidrug efflux system)